ncbi:LysR substrate-binding domain-containing protein [Streptomyces sp. NPDC055722]
MLIGIPPGLHPELRSRVDVLTERVRERFELRHWPGTTPALVAGVREGRLALALARMPFSDPALDQVRVMSECMGAAVPADRFAGPDSVTLADLEDLAYVAPPKGVRPAHFDVLDGALADLGIRNRHDLTDTGYAGISEVISGGNGLRYCHS